uniref:Armadillo repeat-containing domain-containing protein n=1 Tax=Setaria italica TaxID=4555 RepID=K3ZLE4_SETIT
MPPPPPESADPGLEECLRLLEAVPAAAASSPAFRRHWPSISASLAALSAALASPAFPPSAPLLAPLAAALGALMSAATDAPRLGHLHTLAADARLLATPAPPPSAGAAAGADSGADALISRLRLGSAASRATALEELAGTAAALPAPSAAAAVSAVAALLDSAGGDLLPSSRERAVSVLAAFASSESACRFLAQESGAVVPHLCRALESGGAGAEHACAALLPLTAASRDASAAVAARGGVAALLAACAGGTPAAQAAAAGVLRNLAAFPDLLPWFRDEGALPLLLQLVSLGTPRAQELALGCLQNLTAGDGDEGQRLKVEAFQEGALACPGLAPALGLLRNMASFRYIAEIAVSAQFAAHVAAALGSDRSPTRTEAALALAELCGNSAGKSRHEVEDAVPRLVWMLEAKAVSERDAAARALAALLAASGACRKLFRKDERGIANAVQLLDPAGARGVDRRYPVTVLLAVAQSRRCRKQMVAAGACGFLQGLMTAEVDGAKKLAECLGKGKMLGVFPRT